MANELIDFHNNILRYDGNEKIYVVFRDGTNEPFFNANDVGELLGYSNTRDAISRHAEGHIFKLGKIAKNYKLLYKNAQYETNFLDEAGVYYLVFSSEKENAIAIKKWIIEEVMPELRKYGQYKLDKESKSKMKNIQQQYDELADFVDFQNMKIDELEGKLKLALHNKKKIKYPKGGAVYIMRPIEKPDDLILDQNKIINMKFGKTIDMNNRKSNFDNCVLNKVKILKKFIVKNPLKIERCLKDRIDHFRVAPNKEFFECTYIEMATAVAECIKFIEKLDYDIDITPDDDVSHDKQSRSTVDDFDVNKTFNFKILRDGDGICGIDQNGGSLDCDIDMPIICNNCDELKRKYYKYKTKYFGLKYGIEKVIQDE